MRQYRAIPIGGKEFVYGSLVNIKNHRFFIVPVETTLTPLNSGFEYPDIFIEVISETVGRYTGLKDIDKTEIYASDKIETPNWGTVAVEWSEEKAMYGFWYTSNWGKSWCSLWKAQGDCKVIGNAVPPLMYQKIVEGLVAR